jgi:transcriptional regulator with XRE-family HTH domain
MKKSTHTDEYTAIREELKSARSSAKLTQRALADLLEVNPSWVAKIESGERRVDLLEFCWVLDACERDPLVAFKRILTKVRQQPQSKRRN